MDVKISKNCYLPKRNIAWYASYELNYIRNRVYAAKKDGKAVDLTGKKKLASVIFLKDNSEIILSPISIDTLKQRIDEADE